MLLGLALAIGKRSSSRMISVPIRWATEFVRRTPLLVQLYFLFFILPDMGILLSPLMAGVLGLGIHYSAYTSEVYRAGIENVPRSQWEAAKAVNLSPVQAWLHIVIPQAIPPMVPALGNYVVMMFKETPLLSVITVVELMNSASIIARSTFRYLEPFTLVGIFFLAISIPAVVCLRLLERRLAPGKR